MALGFYFSPSSFSPAQYDEALAKLEAAGYKYRNPELSEALQATLTS